MKQFNRTWALALILLLSACTLPFRADTSAKQLATAYATIDAAQIVLAQRLDDQAMTEAQGAKFTERIDEATVVADTATTAVAAGTGGGDARRAMEMAVAILTELEQLPPRKPPEGEPR